MNKTIHQKYSWIIWGIMTLMINFIAKKQMTNTEFIIVILICLIGFELSWDRSIK